MSTDTESVITTPTDPLDSNPPNTFTEPAVEDPIFVANQTFEGLATIPEDPTQNKLAVYYTDIVPVPFNELEGTNDSFTPTDSNGSYVPPAISYTFASLTNFPFEGGVTTTITGVALDQVSHVRIQNYNCTFVVNSPTQLTVNIPVCPDNDFSTLKTIDCYDVYNALAFSIPITYNPQVQVYGITSIDVASGSLLGNTVVTITGGAFFFISRVIFDGTDVFQFEVVNSTTIVCTTAFKKDAFTGIPGSVQVIDYTGAIVTLPAAYTYVYPTPFILGLGNNIGSTSGGLSIIVAGAYFLNVTNVTLGGIPVTYNVDSETQITFVTNAGTYTGIPLDLVITTLYGTVTYSSAFTYSPPSINTPTITSVSLNAGNVVGGTTFDIYGTNLDNVTGVTIGTFAVASYIIVSPIRLTCVSGAGVYTGTSLDVILNSTFGNVTRPSSWTYTYDPPTITSVNLSTTSAVGGDTVILTGTNFYLVSNVVICGLQAASFVVNSSTQITLVTPIAFNVADTLGNIQVVATFGTATLYNAFTFFGVQTPIVTSILPITGTTAGGTLLTVNGTNFLTTTGVTVDGITASYVIDSNIQLTVTTPAAFAFTGFPVDIVVTNTFGSYTSFNAFTYTQPTPIITSVTPTTGAVAGGNSIVIAGNYFFGATSVTIDGVNATSYVVNSTLQITAVTPSSIYTNVPVDIVVTTPAGTGNANASFLYLPSPAISSVSPNTGGLAGGTTIIITGTSFTNTSSVTLNGIPMTSYVVDSVTQITAVVPAGVSINTPYNIDIVTPQGNYTATGIFTYLGAPTFTSVSPNTGAVAGGNSIVIVGTNFTNATAVKIGATNVTSYTVDSSTQITAVTPAGSVGSAQTITIETPQGNVTSGAVYSYLNTPTFLFVSPTSGNVSGGDSITINGSDFTNATAVKIGTTNVTSYVVVNASTITAVTPAGLYGANETITIETPQGNVTSSLPEFTYYNTPTISGVSPASGNYLGGDTIILTGTDFTNATAVLVGATNVTTYVVDSNTQITFVTPIGTYGNVETITVQTPQGNVTSGSGIFTYLDTPTIVSVAPTSGSPSGGTTIVITGTDFSNATAVKIDVTNVTSYTVDSNTQITAVTPAGTGSNLTITVETPQGNTTSGGLYTYVSGPTITTVSPTSGFTTGGTVLTIIGTGFSLGDTITVDGNPATSVNVVSSTKITCNTPSGTTGAAKDVVLNGSVTSAGAFTYLTPAFNKSRYRSFAVQTVPAGTATYFHDVTYSSALSLFAAVAQFSTGTDGIITSSDGVTWTRRTSPFSEGNNSYLRIVANATRFLTSGNNPNQNATSTNGTTWTNITGIQGIHSLAYSDTLNVWVVPQLNNVWYSSNDTASWSSTAVTVDPLACIWAGTPFNKFFLFPRQNGNILYSTNGSTWTTITPGLNTSLLYYAAAYSSDLSKILLIANTGQVYESTNGTTWSLIGSCVLLGQMRSLLWNGNLQCWFLSGSTGVAVSANGIRWSRIATYSTDTNPDFTTKGIAYSPSLDIFVTAQASMYKSDGALKGSILFGTSNYLTCANSVDFQFGTGDFTIEWYQYQTSITGTQRVFSYGTQIAAQITSAGALEVILGGTTVYTQSLTNYYESQWRHIAIARQGTSLRVFYDGTQLGTTVTNSTNVGNAATVFCIGNASTPSAGSSFIGKITNFHVMKGSAAYTTNFSKPTEDIIAETTNAYTKLLLPAPSTNFIQDYSATPKVVTNVSCTADSSSPYF
jgi:hypothetical protein